MFSKSDEQGGLTRRDFLKVAALTAGGIGLGVAANHWLLRWKQPLAKVAIYKAGNYSAPLAGLIRQGLEAYPDTVRRARGGRVVLKPNLVEYIAGRPVNTHPAVVAAAIEAFRSVGAREVIVAEGPGHQRDTEMLVEQSGWAEALAGERTRFVDLNQDSIHPVRLASNHTGLGRLFLPDTVLGADLVVSMAKMKTHHWAGATLSLKNMFGVVPGAKYGWPKNLLHWRGIAQSIVDINVAVRAGFAIIDGIEGMEGDGPLHGEAVSAGVLIMGENLTAVDATAARVMGIYPERMAHLLMMLPHGGTIHSGRILQLGEEVARVRRPFRVLPGFSYLQQPPGLVELLGGA